jgi:hypothetical protein
MNQMIDGGLLDLVLPQLGLKPANNRSLTDGYDSWGRVVPGKDRGLVC